MTPNYLASSQISHPFVQGHSRDLTVPGVRHPSFTCDATIDPVFLMGANHELLSQHDSSSNPLYISEGDHYRRSPPAPSTSGEVWMGYSGYEASPPVPILINRMVGNRVSALVLYSEVMLC